MLDPAPLPTPPVEAAPPAPTTAGLVIVSHETKNATIASSDRPLVLVKAGRRETAVLRYMLFAVDTTTVVRPTAPAGPDRLQWSFAPYLQRQLCIWSMMGMFTCSEAEVVALGDKSEGEAPAPLPPPEVPANVEVAKVPAEPTAADLARSKLNDALRLQASAAFDQDRRLKVDPLLKAAGVKALPAPTSPRATPPSPRPPSARSGAS